MAEGFDDDPDVHAEIDALAAVGWRSL